MPITVLNKQHDRKKFDCGTPALNEFLKKTARQHSERDISRTFVLTEDNYPTDIIGYHTITLSEVYSPSGSPLDKYPHKLPVLKVARLAVDVSYQRRGVVGFLIADIMSKAIQTHDITPIMGLVVDAKDQAAKAFYQSFGFLEVEAEEEGNEFYLWLPMQTIRESLLE